MAIMRKPKKKFDVQEMFEQAQQSQTAKLRNALLVEQQAHEITRQQLDLAKQEINFHKQNVQLHENREKRRQDGLKKAQQARKGQNARK